VHKELGGRIGEHADSDMENHQKTKRGAATRWEAYRDYVPPVLERTLEPGMHSPGHECIVERVRSGILRPWR